MALVDLELKRALRLIASGPVALVTAQYRDKRNVMTAAWLMPVSSDPPQVAVAVFPSRYTHDLIAKAGDLCLNIPARPLVETVHKVGSVSGADVDKFLTLGLTPYEAKQVHAPRISECIAHIECGLVQTVRVGDHTLFIGQVVAAAADDLAFDGEYWTLADESVTPLNHLGKNVYATLKEKLIV